MSAVRTKADQSRSALITDGKGGGGGRGVGTRWGEGIQAKMSLITLKLQEVSVFITGLRNEVGM